MCLIITVPAMRVPDPVRFYQQYYSADHAIVKGALDRDYFANLAVDAVLPLRFEVYRHVLFPRAF